MKNKSRLTIEQMEKEINRLRHKEILMESMIKTYQEICDQKNDENLELRKELLELKSKKN